MDWSQSLIEHVGTAVELAGVAVIVVGALSATALFFYRWIRNTDLSQAYAGYRRTLGRAILLGLEFLVAGDIIGTVAIAPSFNNVGVLAAIVVVRTFLSFSLEVELEGRWPWQAHRASNRSSTGESAR